MTFITLILVCVITLLCLASYQRTKNDINNKGYYDCFQIAFQKLGKLYEQNQEVITHRIQKIEEDQTTKEKTYITKGDNNNIEDSENIKFSAIIGKCILTIPYLGNIISVLENKLIVLIIILIILILFFLKIQKQEKLENRREKKKIEEEKR